MMHRAPPSPTEEFLGDGPGATGAGDETGDREPSSSHPQSEAQGSLTMPKGEGGMGFWDLPLFNKAMLGKQGWRLITRPDSLCARVIKGKYFPNGEFLTANRKKRSSETWRAMLHEREALVKGIIKRVGPGSSINIWNDNWIPGFVL